MNYLYLANYILEECPPLDYNRFRVCGACLLKPIVLLLRKNGRISIDDILYYICYHFNLPNSVDRMQHHLDNPVFVN